MNLECIILSEVKQSERKKPHVFPHTWILASDTCVYMYLCVYMYIYIYTHKCTCGYSMICRNKKKKG